MNANSSKAPSLPHTLFLGDFQSSGPAPRQEGTWWRMRRQKVPGISDLAVILNVSQEDHVSVAGKAPPGVGGVGGGQSTRVSRPGFSIHSQAPRGQRGWKRRLRG